jgi:hypothetical protein
MAAQSNAKRLWNAWMQLVPSSVWFWFAAVVPFLLIVLLRGWNDTFQTGDAYLYLMGVAVTALAEVGIELGEKGIKGITELNLQGAVTAVLYLCFITGLAIWGLILIHSQPHLGHATTSWIQVALFFYGLSVLSILRFTFRGKESIWVRISEAFKGQRGSPAQTASGEPSAIE